MKFIQTMLLGFLLSYTQFSIAAPLISTKEAALPTTSTPLATRGISRGPAIKLVSPGSDTLVMSPVDFKVIFQTRGEGKIDLASIKVLYMKSPIVDLTPRLKNAINVSGIDFTNAEIPPGSHPIKITVRDLDGRETNSVFTLVVGN